MKNILIFLGLILVAFVVACGSVYESEPVGIGTDYSELKKSPCACLQIEMAPELPSWFS